MAIWCEKKKTITDWWWKTGSMGRWKPGILKMNENYIDPYVLALWLNMNTDDVYNTLIICAEIEHITKAGLLAGAGFALAMNWGLDAASTIFHLELFLGPPCWTWLIMSNCEPPSLGFKPRCVRPAGFHLWPRGMRTLTHIQDGIHREWCEWNGINAM
jgi:hypothetical protein